MAPLYHLAKKWLHIGMFITTTIRTQVSMSLNYSLKTRITAYMTKVILVCEYIFNYSYYVVNEHFQKVVLSSINNLF